MSLVNLSAPRLTCHWVLLLLHYNRSAMRCSIRLLPFSNMQVYAVRIDTVSQILVHVSFFQKNFTRTLSSKFAIKWLLKIPPHLKYVAVNQSVVRSVINILFSRRCVEFHHLLFAVPQDESTPYSFFVDDIEICDSLGQTLSESKTWQSSEAVVQIIYQAQAVFRVRAVTRCTSTIEGHAEPVLTLQFSPNTRRVILPDQNCCSVLKIPRLMRSLSLLVQSHAFVTLYESLAEI